MNDRIPLDAPDPHCKSRAPLRVGRTIDPTWTAEDAESAILDMLHGLGKLDTAGPALVRLIDDIKELARTATYPRLALSWRKDDEDDGYIYWCPVLTCPTCGAALDGGYNADVAQLLFVAKDGSMTPADSFHMSHPDNVSAGDPGNAVEFWPQGVTGKPESAGYLIHDPKRGSKPHPVALPEGVKAALL
jgi:hypothetical protein